MYKKDLGIFCIVLLLPCICTGCSLQKNNQVAVQTVAEQQDERERQKVEEENAIQVGSLNEETGEYTTLQGSILTKEQYQNLKYSFSRNEIDLLGTGVIDASKDNQELWASFSYRSCIWTDGFLHTEKQDKIDQDTAVKIAREEAEHISFLAESGIYKYGSSVVKTAYDEEGGMWKVVFTGGDIDSPYNMETAILVFISDDGVTQMAIYPELCGTSKQGQSEYFSYAETVWTNGFLHTKKGEKINRNTAIEIAKEEIEAIPKLNEVLKDKKEINVEYDGFADVYKITFLKIYPDDVEYGKAEKIKPIAEQVGTNIIVFINSDGSTNRIVYPEW